MKKKSQSLTVCGVRIDSLTKKEAIAYVLSPRKSVCTVYTPNALMLDACRRNPALGDLLNSATLSLPDGAGVLLAARHKGCPLPERVAGIDFGREVLEQAARLGLRVFLLGGKPGVASRAARMLQKELPALTVCGTHHGYFDPRGEENREVLRLIWESRADILFVCLGFPLQEAWTRENLSALESLRLVACLGGSLDVWAGDLTRAPRSVRLLRAEWMWRMLREPRRLRGLPALGRFWVLSHLRRL